ncbi:MAG: helix-turn-helix transcriptional regulator [Gemmatimonadaceae bacterium]|nr:helix-turn-helix transcriptional regulator [Gemmatimonadaceae bacterium]
MLTPELLFALDLPVAYSAGLGHPLEYSSSARAMLDRQPDTIRLAIDAFAKQALAPHVGSIRVLSNQRPQTQVIALDGVNLIIRAARVPHVKGGAGIILVFETLANLKIDAKPKPGVRGGYGLTGREWQVAERVAAGLSSPVIARELNVTVHTVRRHTESIFRKLGVRTRSALAWNLAKHGVQNSLQLRESKSD